MFKITVDEEISLYLPHETFAARYAELAFENFAYLSQWLAWPAFCKTEEDFEGFIKGSVHKYADGISMNCAIKYKGEIVGNTGFNTINQDTKMAVIGYWLAEKYQGKGIITRTTRFLIDYAFKTLDLEKVQISAAEENLPSRAVCERLGMTLEGVLTNQEKVGDRILNHAVYGIHRQH
ncbi:RimJ/RimL family protein N-acetyltransferase [Veronia nyctiphanis]|uniref:RimJ/RimL family protein N-acetyltransferase n=1 Tax=Veronia nyctiphanis TaxID=1278244 RepID=A0A4Q0YQD6_9GAMM|nr:GNAT family protein [Veronia nyctiphanis]RXJ72234.1 RimJ/RimL family protein N-acetyltransferase [Veronia nyctiphanis]